VNFTKIYPRLGFADVTHKADMRSSENLSPQRTVEAVVRDPPVGNHCSTAYLTDRQQPSVSHLLARSLRD